MYTNIFWQELPCEDARELFNTDSFGIPHCAHFQDMFHNSPIVHPDYWTSKPEKRLQEIVKEDLPKLGYHGRKKYKYAFHEPWNPIDRMALLDQAEKEEQTRDLASTWWRDIQAGRGAPRALISEKKCKLKIMIVDLVIRRIVLNKCLAINVTLKTCNFI